MQVCLHICALALIHRQETLHGAEADPLARYRLLAWSGPAGKRGTPDVARSLGIEAARDIVFEPLSALPLRLERIGFQLRDSVRDGKWFSRTSWIDIVPGGLLAGKLPLER